MSKKKNLTGVLFKNGIATLTTLEDSLDCYYKQLEVECIDIVATEVAGHKVEIVCDDEALLKDNPIATAVNHSGKAVLFGNLFITGPANEEGALTSLGIQTAFDVIQQAFRIGHLSSAEGDPQAQLVLVTTYGE